MSPSHLTHLKTNSDLLVMKTIYLLYLFFSGNRKITYSLLQFLPNEWFEKGPHHIENEGLLYYMDLLQPKRHGILNEREQ